MQAAVPRVRLGWNIRNRFRRFAGQLVLFLKLAFLALRRRRRPVVLVRYGGMGDVICSLPAVRAYLEAHPEAEVAYLTLAPFREIVARSGLHLSIVVMAHHVDLPLHLARLITSGYTNLRYGDEKPEPDQPPRHIIDDFALNLGVPMTDRSTSLATDASAVKTARSKISIRTDLPIILLHTGPTWKVREWPTGQWDALVANLQAQMNVTVVQLMSERNLTVSAPGSDRIANTEPLFFDDDIGRLIDTVAAVDLLIAVDSGPLHIAAAVNTPCLSLFGPTDPSLRLWNLQKSVALVHQVPCSFCHHRQPRLHWQTGCPHEIICLRDLSLSAVQETVLRLLTPKPQS